MRQCGNGSTARVFHWLITTLLIVQYLIGWLIPAVERGVRPGDAATLHTSIGIVILALISLHLSWHLTRPVAAINSRPPWHCETSEAAQRLFYALVFATTGTGWLLASSQGRTISLFFAVRWPTLGDKGSASTHAVGQLHEALEWALLVFIAIHIAAALRQLFIERVLESLLPEARS